MNQVKVSVKTVYLLIPLLLSLLLYPSCQLTTSSTSQDKFTLIEHKNPGIQNPELAWAYHQPEHDFRLEGLYAPPEIDLEGNLYFFNLNHNILSFNRDGKKRWEKIWYFSGKQIALTQEGILANRGRSISLISLEGKISWEKSFKDHISDYFISPDGYLIAISSGQIISIGADKAVHWNLKIGEESIFTGSYFFDVESNAYFFFKTINREKFMHEEKRYDFDNYLISISPDGQFRWKKLLTQNRNLIEIVPENRIIKDTFLLAYYQETEFLNEQNMIKIIAYDADGNERWHLLEDSRRSLCTFYTITNNSQFYVYFNEVNSPDSTVKEERSYIFCLKDNGDCIWQVELEGWLLNVSGMDDYGNFYLSIRKSEFTHLYALDNQGSIIWRIPVGRERFNLKPVMDSFGNLYMSTDDQFKIISVREKK